MIKKFISYYKPHAKLFAVDMLCAALLSVCNLVYPVLAKNLMNSSADSGIKLLITFTLILLGIFIIKAIFNYVIHYWGHIVGLRMQTDMRLEMFDRLEGLPFTYYDNNKTGSIMSRLIIDLSDISELAHHAPETLLISLVTFMGSFVVMCFFNVYLALMVLVYFPLMAWYLTVIRKKMKDAFKRVREQTAEINSGIESAVSGMRVSRAYNAQAHEKQKFAAANAKYEKARKGAFRLMGDFHSKMTFLSDLMYLLVLFGAGLMYFYFKTIDSGEYAMFILYVTAILNPIRQLVNIYEQIENGASGFKRFIEVMNTPPEEENSAAVDMGALKGNIEFDDVTFSYSDELSKPVINRLSFTIPSGSTVALVGASGGGKTTACHLLPRFYEIMGGAIRIDGVDIKNITRECLRRNIGMVQQDVFLFGGSIKDNIIYGDFSATDEQIACAARQANIDEFISSLENGYLTCVGERGVKLSGGQKQRIAIARAFLKNPPILILDEATSALDNATEMQIQAALNKLSSGRTTLVVAHRLSTVKNADKIIVLDGGEIAEQGTHAQLLEKNGLYAELYRYQFKEI